MTWGAVIFWVSLFALAYAYVGYPLVIGLLARWFPWPVRKGPFSAPVTVLIAAHNEERVIEQKLRNLLALDRADLIRQILVGSDGSTDRTVERARSIQDPRVRVVEFSQRRGKAAVLDDLVKECEGDIVLLTDARQEIEKSALNALLENFADPDVGVVSGELMFRGADSGKVATSMDTYWNYEKWIRRAEAAFHSVPGATGALYAIRREQLRPIPPETLLDDVVIPMQAVVAGSRCVFEPRAIVWDRPSSSPEQEAIRKRRTLAGNMQLVKLHPEWLCPWRNPIAWQFVSHKLVRLFGPLLLLGGGVGAACAAQKPFYFWAFWVQVALPIIAFALFRWGPQKGWLARGRSIWMFYTLNGIIVSALFDALRGRWSAAWDRAETTA